MREKGKSNKVIKNVGRPTNKVSLRGQVTVSLDNVGQKKRNERPLGLDWADD